MGKKARTKRSDERKKRKRFAKDQQKAKYEGFKNAGTNRKSKRNVLNTRRRTTVRTKKHADGRCYNHGCSRCTNNAYPKLRMNNLKPR